MVVWDSNPQSFDHKPKASLLGYHVTSPVLSKDMSEKLFFERFYFKIKI